MGGVIAPPLRELVLLARVRRKGVCITHTGAARCFDASRIAYAVSSTDVPVTKIIILHGTV